MDYTIEQWINGQAGHIGVLDALMVAVAAGAEVAFAAGVVLWVLGSWIWARVDELRGAISALVAAGVALVINQVAGHVWNHPRPFVAHPTTVHLLLAHSPDGGFPSDHAAAAVAIGVVVLAIHRRVGIAVLVVAALVCYARVFVGDHYPLDVAAGAVIGVVSGSAVLVAAQRIGTPLADRLIRLLPRSGRA
jgi:undecaprenyl-diphosphatase